jgi:hypothetical protein
VTAATSFAHLPQLSQPQFERLCLVT